VNLGLILAFARRDMRGGLGGMAVFLICLMLGVAAIATVGVVRLSIDRALEGQGAVLLGGQAQMSFTYRFATDDERAFMDEVASTVSEVVTFRSMVVVGQGQDAKRALTEVKAVDNAYPLIGQVVLDPPIDLGEALAAQDGVPGALLDPVLADRLGLKTGDRFRLGTKEFRLAARLAREPDSASMGFGFGPRSIVLGNALEGSGLLAPGSLFDTLYRLELPGDTDLDALQQRSEAAFRDTGMRWRDGRNAAPGADRFVRRIGSFLTLVGLAGLAVGGVGIASAVRAYLARKVEAMAVLRVIGAEGGTVQVIYLIEVAVVGLAGILAGLALGIALPLLAAPLMASALPIPVEVLIRPAPLAEAAIYGFLTVAIFAYWPLAEVRRIGPAALFRGTGAVRTWPGWASVTAIAALIGLLVAVVLAFAETAWLARWTLAGIAAAMLLLAVTAAGVQALARRLRGQVGPFAGLRLALASIGAPRGEAGATILALGLGLSVLAAVGQIDVNLRGAIDRELPKVAPAFFFVDIQQDQIDGFREKLGAMAGVARIETAPMLRGVITRINGEDARKVAGDHWVVRGDRGLTYADVLPEKTKITAGEWWSEGYSGPPQISFAAEEADEIGLKLGDKLTVNVLGRDIEAAITSFREVDFSNAGIGFVMTMSPSALAGAPHTFISTVYAGAEVEAKILATIGDAYPNITAIRVRDVTERLAEALGAIAQATAIAAGITLLTGAVVLIGTASAGLPARVHEAAVLKSLGATRRQIFGSFALRAALTGAVAGLVAIGFGALAGWAVMRFVMEGEFTFAPGSASAIVAGGAFASLLAGLVFAWRPLAARPAQVLRSRD
jgi:putative ABC transport system permease protein